MEIEEKKKLMAKLHEGLKNEGMNLTLAGFDTVLYVDEKPFCYRVKITNDGKYCIEGGFMTMCYNTVKDCLNTIFLMFHCLRDFNRGK